jgi:hypothetical protein
VINGAVLAAVEQQIGANSAAKCSAVFRAPPPIPLMSFFTTG